MALYLDGEKVLPRCDSASDTTFDDTNVAYEADDVQEALEKVTKSLTYAEYQELTEEEKNNGTLYFITDVNGDGQRFQPIIYSTEEREIGVWTDGKPLYEKTLEINGTFNLSNNAWTDIISIPNIDIISELSYYFSGISEIGMTDGRLRWSYSYSTKYLRAAASTGTTITNPIITIRYTKTTDTPGSGTWTPQGVPAVHYSTDEHVIGTWIDGKTLYEKTYSYSISSETLQEITALDSNIIVKEIKGIMHNTGNDMIIPWIDASFFYNVYISSAHKLTAIKKNTGDWTGQVVEITIRYTKSST